MPGKPQDDAQPNRGQRAHILANGEVRGSGSGAGGGGAPEDFDSDSAAGGGTLEVDNAKPAGGTGADAPSHGSR